MTERGIQRTSMEDIASAAGVSRGTLYTYAKSKDEILLMSLAEESLTQLKSFASLLRPNVDPKARLEDLLVQKILFYEKSPFAAMLVEGDISMLMALRSSPHFLEVFGSEEFRRMQNLSAWIQAASGNKIAPPQLANLDTAVTAFIGAGPSYLRKVKELGGELEPCVRTLARVFVSGLGVSNLAQAPGGDTD